MKVGQIWGCKYSNGTLGFRVLETGAVFYVPGGQRLPEALVETIKTGYQQTVVWSEGQDAPKGWFLVEDMPG